MKIKEQCNFIVIDLMIITVITIFILAIALTKSGMINNTLINLFFGVIGICGYYILKKVFQYLSSKHHFTLYALILCIVYILGYINGKYV